tara:strand:- start:385 stop:762 length:378 start_codon:yes stop_codon:yes gene_type:complete
MSLPKEIKYTDDHEWAKLDDNIVTIGITDFAQSELGDIIFVEFPDLNMEVSEKDTIGTLEAVKTVADIFSPLSGKIIEINNNLESNPELINESPYDNGWILKIKISDKSQFESLLSSVDYEKIIK